MEKLKQKKAFFVLTAAGLVAIALFVSLNPEKLTDRKIAQETSNKKYQNLATSLKIKSEGEVNFDGTVYQYATRGNSKIYFRYQPEQKEVKSNFIEGNTVMEFEFDDINSKNRNLKTLTTIMQIDEGFNVESINYENQYPDKGTFCSNFGEFSRCFTLGAYFCSKLYRHFGDATNAFKNRTKILQCYNKVDFLRMYTTIHEDPSSKALRKIADENLVVIKDRFTDNFGKRKTKESFLTIDFDLLTESGNDERAEYFVQLMGTLNACESMFKTSKVLQYMEQHHE